jgi:hypothetical protein
MPQLHAQYNLSTLYSMPGRLPNAGNAPSLLRLYGSKRVEVGLLNLHVNVSSPNVDHKAIYNFLEGGKDRVLAYDDPRKQALLDGIDRTVRVGLGLHFTPLALAIQTGGERAHTFSFGVQERVGFNLRMGSDFAEFALYGNKRFAGRELYLAEDLRLNLWHAREFALGYAVNLPAHWLGIDPDKGWLRAGIRLKAYSPTLGLRLSDTHGSVYTDPNGDSLRLSVRGRISQTLIDEDGDFSPFRNYGGGAGLDFSLSAQVNERLNVTAGILDVGSIKFNKNVESYQVNEQGIFRGMEMRFNYFENRSHISAESDMDNIKADTVSGGEFTIALPTRLMLHTQLGLGQQATDKRDQPYHKHTLMLTYIQGLQEVPQGSLRPLVAVGYKYSLANRLHLGTNVSMLSPSSFTVGAFASVTTPLFNFGIGSDNFLHSLTGKWMMGANFATNMSFAF